MSETGMQTVTVERRFVKKPRLGFVGVGWIGWHRMKSLAASSLGEMSAILEPQADMAARAKQLAPDADIVTSFEEMLHSEVDGVVIATPSALHAEQAIRALENGIAVFCQKPLGRDRQETQLVINAARRANRLLGVDLCYRFVEGVVKIHELIQREELGNVFAMDLVFHNAYGPDKNWFYDPRLSGGGCLIDLGIHLVDLALWLIDFPRVDTVSGRMFAGGRRFAGRDTEVEDFAEATIRLENSASVRIGCSWRAHAGQDAVIEVALYGTRGGASLRNVNGSFYDFTAEHFTGTARRTLAIPPDDWGGRAASQWLAQLCNSNAFDPAIQSLGTVAEVLDRIYAS